MNDKYRHRGACGSLWEDSECGEVAVEYLFLIYRFKQVQDLDGVTSQEDEIKDEVSHGDGGVRFECE